MTGDMAFVFGVLGVAVVQFAGGRVRLDVVALLVLNAYFLDSSLYIDAALVLSIFGFISTVAIAKYLERGDLFAS